MALLFIDASWPKWPCIVRVPTKIFLYLSVLTDSVIPVAIRTRLIPEVVLCAWMGLSAIKTSDEQVHVWMVTLV